MYTHLGATSGVRLDAVHRQDAVHHHEEPGGCVVAFPEQHLPCTRTEMHLPLVHPGGNPGANLKSISHRCYLRRAEFESDLTKETIYLPLGYLQDGRVLGLRMKDEASRIRYSG